MAFDAARQKIVLFGGYAWDGSKAAQVGDTWEWDGAVWNRAATTGPPARNGAAMAYDSARHRTVLFGGYCSANSTSTYYRDTWEWDGATWTRLATTGPPASVYSSAAYDSARGRTVLFGGVTASGTLRETWEWDGSTWLKKSTTGPSARGYAAMAYNASRGTTMLYGGSSASGVVPDTWEWDGAAWKQVAASGPSARSGMGMAYDSGGARLVLFGGDNLEPDTWEWTAAGWRQAGSAPRGRYSFAMAYDAGRARAVLFGGYGGVFLGDTWEWAGATWQKSTDPGPATRSGACMAYDSARGRVVLFGGYSYDGANDIYYSDTWERAGDTWTRVATDGPPAGTDNIIAYDSVRARTVLLNTKAGSTWFWDGAAWTQADAVGPSQRNGASMVFDTRRGKAVLFGGSAGSYPSYTYSADTWEWDGTRWMQAASDGPPARASASMAYDSARGRTVLFGGIGSSGDLADCWEWDGARWTQMPASGPAARDSGGMIYDSARAKVVHFGGWNAGMCADTWEYSMPHPFTLGDATTALELAAGFSSTNSADIASYDIVGIDSSRGRVDLLDAIAIARKAAGLEANP